MRSADLATVVRTLLAVLVVYLIVERISAAAIVFLIAFVMFLDAFDGFLAVSEESKGKFSFSSYVKALLGDRKAAAAAKKIKEGISKSAPHGPRMDIAGDRVVEYLFWIVFTYLRILPLFVIILVVIRHSFTDAFMGSRGTSSKMKTRFARIVYSSSLGRGGINVVKFLTFAYLSLVYIAGYPIIYGYALTAVLVIYIMLRGAAEIYESLGA